MQLTYNELRQPKIMLQRAKILLRLSKLATFIAAALLLGSVVLGCSSNPPVPQVSVYRPPTAFMTQAPTQYLLPPEQQRKTRSSTTVPSQP